MPLTRRSLRREVSKPNRTNREQNNLHTYKDGAVLFVGLWTITVADPVANPNGHTTYNGRTTPARLTLPCRCTGWTTSRSFSNFIYRWGDAIPIEVKEARQLLFPFPSVDLPTVAHTLCITRFSTGMIRPARAVFASTPTSPGHLSLSRP